MGAHKELIIAVMDRDIPAAGQMMHDHVETTGEFVLDSIRAGQLAQS